MKIAALCGHGLGSSFMVEMNIKKTLQKLNLDLNNFELIHADVSSSSNDLADLFFVGADLRETVSHLDNVIILENIIDIEEVDAKLTTYLTTINLI